MTIYITGWGTKVQIVSSAPTIRYFTFYVGDIVCIHCLSHIIWNETQFMTLLIHIKSPHIPMDTQWFAYNGHIMMHIYFMLSIICCTPTKEKPLSLSVAVDIKTSKFILSIYIGQTSSAAVWHQSIRLWIQKPVEPRSNHHSRLGWGELFKSMGDTFDNWLEHLQIHATHYTADIWRHNILLNYHQSHVIICTSRK